MLNDRIECIKDVVMDGSGKVCFTKGKTYEANTQKAYVQALNNHGELHELGRQYSGDKWFKEHFSVIK